MDSGKSSKKKEKSGKMSLADMLAANKSSSGAQTRSKRNVASLEELQKALNGNQGTSSKLNMSNALSIGIETMKLMDISQIKQEDAKGERNEGGSINPISANQNILGKGGKLRSVKFDNSNNAKAEYGSDTVNRSHREYQKMISKAEKEKFLSFDEEDQEEETKSRTVNFNLLRLPKGLNLERGRVNVYKSGIIEVLTNDPTPKVYRFKPTVFQEDTNPTTLVIATDSQAYLDSFEVYETATLSQK